MVQALDGGIDPAAGHRGLTLGQPHRVFQFGDGLLCVLVSLRMLTNLAEYGAYVKDRASRVTIGCFQVLFELKCRFVLALGHIFLCFTVVLKSGLVVQGTLQIAQRTLKIFLLFA